MGGDAPRPDSGPDRDAAHITPELLADLQAGLLDDATAARIRSRARSDPEVARMLAQLDAVRRELAGLGTDEQSAPDVPANVTARVGAALRSAPHPRSASTGGHTVPRPQLTRGQRAGLVVGVGAATTAVVAGALLLTRDPDPAFPTGPTAAQITVDRTTSPGFPLPDAELRAALSRPADLGPLADPQRRASCLAGLGYSPTQAVLGGRTLDVAGRPGVLLLVPADAPDRIRAVVVGPTCAAANTGLLAETLLSAP
ncbi:MAG: hypothetical protein K0U76_13735 [Actinomycetia bacterium]|nr:hypothetical protein [Actinomycetes bacterium]MCH9702412.1 hypothetical protein [Actinomycetes bacterium]MCH9761218.1 hypothetical protein [Actinomycetes bacterium]